MNSLKNSLISLILFLVIGCDSIAMKYDKNIKFFDDELIFRIKNSSNKTELEYNDLPTSIISSLENSYQNHSFLSELRASGLGYELTYSKIDSDGKSFKKIYFNINGKKLNSTKDYDKRNDICFELVYPVSFIMPSGLNISISNDGDWEEIKTWYDNNFNSSQKPTLKYPVDIIFEAGNSLTINNEEQMIEAKDNCLHCMEFIYPVVFILPDESKVVVESNNQEGWKELKNWYEQNSNEKFDWDLEYPVQIKLEGGTLTTVNSLSEIEIIKQNCEF